MADIFLSPDDKLKLQELYGVWNHHINPHRLVEPLYMRNMITDREKEEINVKKTNYEKNEYMFDNILMKAPYEQMEVIYQILMKTGDVAHKGIAARLPRRPSSVAESMEPFRQLGSGTVPVQATNYHDEGHGKDFRLPSVLQEDRLSTEQDTVSNSMMGHSSLDIPNQYRQDSQLHTGNDASHEGQASVSSIPGTPPFSGPRLGFYKTKPRNNKHFGKGVCAIFANFTGQLPGYEQDIFAIANFFGEKLEYEVFGADEFDENYRNLTREKMLETLKRVQHYLCDSIAAAKIDRFFLFILSHGDEKGIKTCAAGSDCVEETMDNGNTVHVTPEEIANMFTHDKVKSLEGYPKCIFIQNCRGAEDVQQAARKLPSPRPTAEISIGADVLLCHATKLGNLSWVSHDGSWFIKTIIETFKAHYENEHIIDLIGEVNNLISQKVGYGEVHGRRVYVKQLPDICYSLRKKFYLSIPKHLAM